MYEKGKKSMRDIELRYHRCRAVKLDNEVLLHHARSQPFGMRSIIIDGLWCSSPCQWYVDANCSCDQYSVFAGDPGETFPLRLSDALSENGPFEELKAGRGVSLVIAFSVRGRVLRF